MKRIAVFVLVAIGCVGAGFSAYQAANPVPATTTTLSKYIPAGPLLYLEAQDFSSLLADWNSSTAKRQWLASSNYEVFSRSRLFLRLKGAGDQFATAAGLPPDMNFVSQVAGRQSAIALYDIGKLEFLYVTYLPAAKSAQTTLWQTRAKFEPRSAAGVSFYVRRDPESQREIAFAVAGDYLLLATRAELVAGALQLISGSHDRTVEAEPWWSQAVNAAAKPGDLRMVLNLEKIVPSSYFRTYWVQQNITDMSQYSAGVVDLFRSSRQYREERVLIPKATSASPPGTAPGGAEVAALRQFVPEGAAHYEARANPPADFCFDLLESKLLAPHLGPAPPSEVAPQVQLTSGNSGASSDLETRIDQATVPRPSAAGKSALKELLDRAPINASLQLQSTETESAGVFVRIHSAIVLSAAADWDEAAVESALAEFIRPSLTAGNLGVAWEQKSGYRELDGLWPLVVTTRGRYLIIADDQRLMEEMLRQRRTNDPAPAQLIAGFDHARQAADFARLASVVDRPSGSPANVPGMERQPQFFSENIASLSSALAAVSTENIVVRRDQNRVLQTVTYEWSQ